MPIHYSETADRFYVEDGDDLLWFDSLHDARDAKREIEIRQAVDTEVKKIAAWLKKLGLTQCAIAIQSKDYHK